MIRIILIVYINIDKFLALLWCLTLNKSRSNV